MVIIRKAKLKDAKQITELHLKLMRYHEPFDKYYSLRKNARKTTLDYNKKAIRSPKKMVLVAEDKNKIIGFIVGELEKGVPIFKRKFIGRIGGTYILSKYRRKGITKQLIKILFDWFRSKKIEFIELYVDHRNTLGLKTWEKMGFKNFQKRMKIKL